MLDELERADAAVEVCADAAVWAVPERQLVEALDRVHRLEQRLAAVKLSLIREIDGHGVPAAQGASSTAVWLRERLRLTVPAARRLIGLADALDGAPAPVREALAGGRIDAEQARVIAETAATVDASAGREPAVRAAELLVERAGRFEPSQLRRLGSRILDHVAPEVAEAALARALEAEAARTERDPRRRLSVQAQAPRHHPERHPPASRAGRRSPPRPRPAKSPLTEPVALAWMRVSASEPHHAHMPRNARPAHVSHLSGRSTEATPGRDPRDCHPARVSSPGERFGPTTRLWTAHRRRQPHRSAPGLVLTGR